MATEAFLKLDGITGESDKDEHKGECDIMSFNWGASNDTIMGVGTGASTGRATVSDFTVSKATDLASPDLFQKCCDGTVIPTGVVTLRKQMSGKATNYLVCNFTDVYVTDIQWHGSGGPGDTAMETVSFSFQTGTVDYTQVKEDGSAGETKHGGWDVGQNIKK
jgi:type VI secretion system secreted protein Hcp